MNQERLGELKKLVENSRPKPEPKTGARPTLIGGSFTPTLHKPDCPCDDCIEQHNIMSGIVFNGSEFRDATNELISYCESLRSHIQTQDEQITHLKAKQDQLRVAFGLIDKTQEEAEKLRAEVERLKEENWKLNKDLKYLQKPFDEIEDWP